MAKVLGTSGVNARLSMVEPDLHGRAAPRVLALLPEEPVFSGVVRQACLAADKPSQAVVRRMLGGAQVPIDRPFHAGLKQLATCIYGSTEYADKLSAQHVLAALPRPFLEASELEHLDGWLKGDKPRLPAVLATLRPKSTFRATPAICVECVAADEAANGFAYFRRSHLVRGVAVCPTHGRPLIETCSQCEQPFSHWRMPRSVCDECGHPFLLSGAVSGDRSLQSSALRLATFIEACLSGDIGRPDKAVRLAALRERTSQIVRNRSGVVGDNLARHLECSFGKGLLESLGLSVRQAPTLGWPALLIHGQALVGDPIANCLIMASLFESPADFKASLRTTPQPTPRVAVTRAQRSKVTPAVLREVLRSLHTNAGKRGLRHGKLTGWIRAYPGLRDRHATKRRREALATHKRQILKYLAMRPGASRGEVLTAHPQAAGHVLRHDRRWMDVALPLRRTAPGRTPVAHH